MLRVHPAVARLPYARPVSTCDDCYGARAVPSLLGDYETCPSCVIDAGDTFVIFEPLDDGQH